MKKIALLFFTLVLVGAGCAKQQPVQPELQSQPKVAEPVTFIDGTYTLDVANSNIGWEASKVKVTHNGTVQAKEGSLLVENGLTNEGRVVVDMTTIKNLDQEGKFLELLENHLKSNDFFRVKDDPTSTFELIQIESLSGLEDENYRIDGTLTIKGIEQPLSFPGKVETTEEGIRLTGRATVDRTQYDIRFGSGKFFENLGDNLIDDEFYLDLDLLFVPVTK